MCFFTSCYHQPHQSLHSLEFSKSISLLSFALKQIHRFLFCLLLFCSAIASNIWGSCFHIWYFGCLKKNVKKLNFDTNLSIYFERITLIKKWILNNRECLFCCCCCCPTFHSIWACWGEPPFSNNFFLFLCMCDCFFNECEWMCMCRIKLKLQTLTDTLCSFCCCISIVAVKYAIFR